MVLGAAGKVMKAISFQDKDQVPQMSSWKTLEFNPNHLVVVDLLAKVKASKADPAVVDSTQVLVQTVLIETGERVLTLPRSSVACIV